MLDIITQFGYNERMTKLLAVLLLCTFSALAQAAHSVTLNWTDPQVATWNVYRAPVACSASPVFVKLTLNPITVKTYVDNTVTAPGSFCYNVTAVIAGVESNPSNNVSAVYPSAPSLTITVQ